MNKLTADGLFEKGDIALQLAILDCERERLLVLATKHCPNEHHDFDEIRQLANDPDVYRGMSTV